ncbi:S-type anion channel SLAH1-like protein [Cinnamomum micranthum f. kanehirae]|uniref:S-type anion channel SLAH1-like protein n=1 Tax=Cinnamomum micranthum f. kanehirae TaxID=337451 RepID=A0A3S4PXJ9_9MAGN|nr:S-type anion channel SLAH1-like protein [Cinnamomum micranthum f. kanehirae]
MNSLGYLPLIFPYNIPHEMEDKEQPTSHEIEIIIDATEQSHIDLTVPNQQSKLPLLARFHAGYFRISLSLCSQVLLWKTLSEPTMDSHAFHKELFALPSTAFLLLWSISLFILLSLSILYLLRCIFYFNMVKSEFLHHVGVNYLFAPWISWLLLLQSSPFVNPIATYYPVLWWVFTIPIVALDLKIYGQWFIKGKRFLWTVANPTSQLSVIGNLVGARAAAQMGWKESAVFMFSLGMVHYLVLYVTLYQRLSGGDQLPVMLRPVFFLFIATPSTASLAWYSISGSFGVASKMLFFLSLFLFASLVSRPALFKRSMQRFHVAWWAYSFPLSVLALASIEYAQEVKGGIANLLMLVLLALSVLVSLGLLVFTTLNSGHLLPDDDPIIYPPPHSGVNTVEVAKAINPQPTDHVGS